MIPFIADCSFFSTASIASTPRCRLGIVTQRKSPGLRSAQGSFQPRLSETALIHGSTALVQRYYGYEIWHGDEISRAAAMGQGELIQKAVRSLYELDGYA